METICCPERIKVAIATTSSLPSSQYRQITAEIKGLASSLLLIQQQATWRFLGGNSAGLGRNGAVLRHYRQARCVVTIWTRLGRGKDFLHGCLTHETPEICRESVSDSGQIRRKCRVRNADPAIPAPVSASQPGVRIARTTAQPARPRRRLKAPACCDPGGHCPLIRCVRARRLRYTIH